MAFRDTIDRLVQASSLPSPGGSLPRSGWFFLASRQLKGQRSRLAGYSTKSRQPPEGHHRTIRGPPFAAALPYFCLSGRKILILVDPKPAGPLLGYYNGRPIPGPPVIDYFGRRYVHAGIAPRHRNGRYDIDALATGERLVEPGLVYRAEESRKEVA